MRFLIVLITSILVFIVFRFFYVLLVGLLTKIFKVTTDGKFRFSISIVMFLIYLQGLAGAVQGVLKSSGINRNFEWYLIYTFMGISAILWCYFSWDEKWNSHPKFGEDEIAIYIKKIIVFALVMIFTFYHGYTQLNKQFSGEEADVIVSVTHITIVPGIIALDRVLNQFKGLLKEKKEKKRKANK